ncbi:uncharacterized protein LOC119653211 isoform X2 [Hermetia illucens]|uniref:uncharacterized protein LOC119653211 isoform X2 n=1 Tax=Hermetia illucens TaxID=343691 RepID=UPI0018CC1EA3|nr:uncharacterized protein LOC119653211 isoform X2 [Hermetia illucens]
MWGSAVWDKHLMLSFMFFQSQVMVHALRDVKVTVPSAVRKGGTATLRCSYDMEGDSLYSVKWYKGRREFYRYTPKENPAMKIFITSGIHVQRHLSNESQLTLASVQSSTSGKYSCEVSADAPSFHTLIASGELEVVVPEGKPVITGIKSRYQIGEGLRANCTSRHSKPAANLSWAINDQPANPLHVKHHRALVDPRNDYQTSISGIQFVVLPQHFSRGKLKLRCIAHIHDIFWQSTERSIEEERPRVHSVAASSNNINSIPNGPYDQFSLQDGDLPNKKDTYMTHMQGDMSSLNAGSAFISSSLILTLFMLQLQQMFISHLSKVSQISTSTAATSRNTEANGQHRTRTTATRTKSSSATTTRKSKCCNSCRTSDTTHVLDYSRRTNDTIPDSYHSLLLKKQQHCSYVRMGASGATALCMDLTNS